MGYSIWMNFDAATSCLNFGHDETEIWTQITAVIIIIKFISEFEWNHHFTA